MRLPRRLRRFLDGAGDGHRDADVDDAVASLYAMAAQLEETARAVEAYAARRKRGATGEQPGAE